MVLRAERRGDDIILCVDDEGPGIEPEDAARIFEPFHHAHGSNGSGLGLAIARGFVTANGGRIWVERAASGGASFVLALPVAELAPVADMTQSLLVVDDEPQFLRTLATNLRGAGYAVETAETVKAALSAAKEGQFDAVVLDLILPDGSGTDVCAGLRAWSDVPIVVVSAVGEEQEKVDALDAGADDYVVKPFPVAELLARLRAVLRRAAPSSEPCSALDRSRSSATVDPCDETGSSSI